MRQKEWNDIFEKAGYRFCKGRPAAFGVYYKYDSGVFHVVLVAEPENGDSFTAEEHQEVKMRILERFYRPAEFLAEEFDECPVYHVELLTLLVGGEESYVRNICTKCQNVWAYRPKTGQLLIYENQPGDFFGLRNGIASAAPERRRMPVRIPYLTVALIAVNVLVYLIMELVGNTQDALFIIRYGGLYPPYVSEGHQWWRLLTAGFIHFGAAHLVNNMLILYCMGERLERAVGSVRMAVVYLTSLLGGNLLSFFMARQMPAGTDYAVSAGASGAVYGVIGGFLWIVLRHKGNLEGIRAGRIIFMILLMIYYGFTSGGIDNWGHIGGVITGFFVTIVFYRRNNQKC